MGTKFAKMTEAPVLIILNHIGYFMGFSDQKTTSGVQGFERWGYKYIILRWRKISLRNFVQ